MPRGDHRPGCCSPGSLEPCKRIGEPRPHRVTVGGGTQPHARLGARIKDWEAMPSVEKVDDKNLKSKESGQYFRKPGSQRKGKR